MAWVCLREEQREGQVLEVLRVVMQGLLLHLVCQTVHLEHAVLLGSLAMFDVKDSTDLISVAVLQEIVLISEKASDTHLTIFFAEYTHQKQHHKHNNGPPVP